MSKKNQGTTNRQKGPGTKVTGLSGSPAKSASISPTGNGTSGCSTSHKRGKQGMGK